MTRTADQQEAVESLNRIKLTQNVIKAKGARDYIPWFGWAIFILIAYPPFDFVRGDVWQPVATGLFALGMLFTLRYYQVKNRQVHAMSHVPMSAIILSILLIATAVLFGNIFQTKFSFSWTVSGVILAGAFASYGLYLKYKK